MPKYNITITKKYELVDVEGKTVDDAKDIAWSQHQQALENGQVFPSAITIKHKRVREELETHLTHKQKKELKKEQDAKSNE